MLGPEFNVMIDSVPLPPKSDTKMKTSVFPVLSTEPLSVVSSRLGNISL